MPESHQLIIKQPISALNGALNIDCKEIFASVAKSLIAGISGQTSTSIEYGVDALKEIGLKDKPENVAWQLVISSFLNSFTRVADEFKDLLTKEINDAVITDLTHRIDHLLNNVKITIDSGFFERPQDLNLFDEFEPVLDLWLGTFGMNGYQVSSFQNRLKRQFVLALNETWSKDQALYKCIIDTVITPFTPAVTDQIAWNNYSIWLSEQANTRVFDEAFGLKEIYIPLRAYSQEKCAKENKDKKYVCDLHSTMLQWLNQFDKKDPIKVVSGGPGSGKSSFAKILCSEIIEQKIAPALFIPLHHFNMTNNLIEAVDDFITDTPYLRNNPLDQKFLQKRLILVFDGLDELSEQGQAAKAAAENFIDNLIRVIERKNDNGNQWQAIVTGRDLSIQANQHSLRNKKQVLHLLPYRLKNNSEAEEYEGDTELLKSDQCNLWWEKFGVAKGHGYTAIPEVLNKDNLFPITQEPLLNYLLALSYERKKIDFDKTTSLNTIYYDLLLAVYERNYAGGYRHAASRHLKFEEFLAVLEEIALAVWHGNGRTASERYLLKRCKEAGLTQHLEKFSESAKKGVVKLLTAFYFREFDTNSANDRTFEFTHKSFGEYLAAKRIVGFAIDMEDEVSRFKSNNNKGWSHTDALKKWIELTGPTLIDEYLYEFVENEVVELSNQQHQGLQELFIELLSLVVREGSPMETLGLSGFAQMLEHSRNAELGLLAMHSACAKQTQNVLPSEFNQQFSRWLGRVNGSSASNSQVGRNTLDMLDISNEN